MPNGLDLQHPGEKASFEVFASHNEQGGEFVTLAALCNGEPVVLLCALAEDGSAKPVARLLREEELLYFTMEDGTRLCDPDPQQH